MNTTQVTDQTLQGCIGTDHGYLYLRGILTGAQNARGEQIVLVLKDPTHPTRGKFYSPVCARSRCIFTVTLKPGGDKWAVLGPADDSQPQQEADPAP